MIVVVQSILLFDEKMLVNHYSLYLLISCSLLNTNVIFDERLTQRTLYICIIGDNPNGSR